MATEPKYDWYETDQQVVINIMVKKVVEADLIVKCEPNCFSFRYVDKSSDKEYELKLNLFGEIVAVNCSHRVSPMKVEVKLCKASSGRWSKLVGSATTEEVCFGSTFHCGLILFYSKIPKTIPICTSENTAQSVKSSFDEKWKAWNSLVSEVEKEEEEGVDGLFKKIYATGDDDLRKAMIKSFTESNGTVLSTNWNDVSRGTVETKPPESSEFKKW